MAITAGRENRWWWDVLERGPSSEFARYFDVDWDSPDQRLRNVVLLPVLGDQYGRVLEAGEIRLCRDGPSFTIRYHEQSFPIEPSSLSDLLAVAPATPEQVRAGESAALAAVDKAIAAVNASPDALDALLERQHYRLAWWQSADRDLGYRRFFDVNSLIGLCAEDEKVFRDTHALVLSWVQSGAVDGLRIDHPDGLRDPEEYLRRLQANCPTCYVVVEKILAPGEELPASWPVQGTTGYDFLNLVNGLFVDSSAEAALTEFYASFTGASADFAAIAREKKLLVLRDTLGSDVNRLAELLLSVCARHRRHRDYTRHHLTDAVFELVACFPVYRGYVRPSSKKIGDVDRQHLDEAVRRVRSFRPDLDTTLLDFIREIVALHVTGPLESEFVLRFQQLCAPAMAKGVEDTAFYTFNRFVALNEVGGDPGRFGVSPQDFHDAMTRRQARYPTGMNATDTHHAKRGEDVRARLGVLARVPAEWMAAVRAWSAMNEPKKTIVAGNAWPDANAEYLLYQALVGAWPIEAERLQAYMEKASREAKAHTTWAHPDAPYESAMRTFIERLMADTHFLSLVSAFALPLIAAGRDVALAQTLLKLTAPGVPDIYQGTELWAHSLVDPDNRRAVDYGARRTLLAALESATADDVMARSDAGLPKLFLVRRALALRAERPDAFGAKGDYAPLHASGSSSDRVLAFVRGGDVVVVLPRLMPGTGWGDTSIVLPEGRWCDRLTGSGHHGAVPVQTLLGRFPVGLLAREGG